jgi:hypothetical protein
VLCRKRAAGRDAFDVGEEQAAERNNALDVAEAQRRECQRRQARRNLSRRRYAESGQPEHGSHDDRKCNDPERDRFSRQPALPEHEQHKGDNANGKHEMAHLAQLTGKQQGSLEEVVSAARGTDQARQLGHGDRQSGARLEADEDAVTDQLDQCAEAQHPGDDAQRGHRQAGEAGDLRVALRVPAGHRPDRSGNHQRDRGGGPDRQLTPTGRSRDRPADSRTRRPAAAGRQARHRPGQPGSRRPPPLRRRPRLRAATSDDSP